MKGLLEVQNLEVNFNVPHGTIRAVRNISFSLSEGETLAIVGESGCGKSVLCKSLIGLLCHYAETMGQALFRGRDLISMNERDLNCIRGKDISIVLQNPASSLNPTYSVGRQITEAIILHCNIGKNQAKARAIELMDAMGIDEPEKRFNQFPHEFSGGMCQRAVIAMALSCDPAIIIADEPTTALDVTIQARILNLFKQIRANRGVSMLFVTHDLRVASEIAHRAAVMYAGKIVEIGTVDEVFTDARHPYTRALLSSLPEAGGKPIPGMPPDLSMELKGDAFAPRNRFALAIDYEEEPPMFRITDTHFAATWLLHPEAELCF